MDVGKSRSLSAFSHGKGNADFFSLGQWLSPLQPEGCCSHLHTVQLCLRSPGCGTAAGQSAVRVAALLPQQSSCNCLFHLMPWHWWGRGLWVCGAEPCSDKSSLENPAGSMKRRRCRCSRLSITCRPARCGQHRPQTKGRFRDAPGASTNPARAVWICTVKSLR